MDSNGIFEKVRPIFFFFESSNIICRNLNILSCYFISESDGCSNFSGLAEIFPAKGSIQMSFTNIFISKTIGITAQKLKPV